MFVFWNWKLWQAKQKFPPAKNVSKIFFQILAETFFCYFIKILFS